MAWQEVRCGNCNGAIQVFEAMLGTDVSCPHCRKTVRVPDQIAPQPAARPSSNLDPYDQLKSNDSSVYWLVVASLIAVGAIGFLLVLFAIQKFIV